MQREQDASSSSKGADSPTEEAQGFGNVPEKKLTFCLTNQRRGRGVRTTCHRRFHQCRHCSNWCCGVDDHRDRRVFLLFNQKRRNNQIPPSHRTGQTRGTGIKTGNGQKSMPISTTKRRGRRPEQDKKTITVCYSGGLSNFINLPRTGPTATAFRMAGATLFRTVTSFGVTGIRVFSSDKT